MIDLLLSALLGMLVVGGLALALEGVLEVVSGWLREQGLEKSRFMDALVLFDRVRNHIRRTIFLRDHREQPTWIREEMLSPDVIQDADVLAMLNRGDQVSRLVNIH